MVMGVCRRLLSRAQDAEDAFQATFLVLVRKAASVISRDAVGGWLHGVAYNTALRAKAASVKLAWKERQVELMPEREAVQQDQLEELQLLLDKELSRLPAKYRLAVALCDLEGRSRKETARHLKIPEGTLSSRLTTARRLLVKRLARHGARVTGAVLAAVLARNVASASVPATIASSTINAASLLATGQTAGAGVIPVKVAALTEGVLRTMLLNKLRLVVLFLAVCGCGTGIGVIVCRAALLGVRNCPGK